MLSVLLTLATEYKIAPLRAKALKQLLLWWPTTLAQWEVREKDMTSTAGAYIPRPGLAHPS